MSLRCVFAIAILLSACAHRPPPQLGRTLFPNGTYKHSVHVEMKDQNPYPANGVLFVDSNTLKLFMLGPMDVTVLKITETFADDTVIIENHLPQLKEHEGKMRRVYDVLRSFILYPRHAEKWGALKATKINTAGIPETFEGPRDIRFFVTEFKNNRPTKFRVVHPYVTVSVEELP